MSFLGLNTYEQRKCLKGNLHLQSLPHSHQVINDNICL
jgi:hypothetical protein